MHSRSSRFGSEPKYLGYGRVTSTAQRTLCAEEYTVVAGIENELTRIPAAGRVYDWRTIVGA